MSILARGIEAIVRRDKVGQAAPSTGQGGAGLAPWNDPKRVRAWVKANPDAANGRWAADATWRKWIMSPAGDPKLAKMLAKVSLKRKARVAKAARAKALVPTRVPTAAELLAVPKAPAKAVEYTATATPVIRTDERIKAFARGCKFVTQGDRVVALCAVPLEDGSGRVTIVASVPLAPIKRAIAARVQPGVAAKVGWGWNPVSAITSTARAVGRVAKKVGAAAAVKKLAVAAVKINKVALLAPTKAALKYSPAVTKWGAKVAPFVGAVPCVGNTAEKLLVAGGKLSPYMAKINPRITAVVDAAGSFDPIRRAKGRKVMRAVVVRARAGDPRAKRVWTRIRAVNTHRQAQAIHAARQRPAMKLLLRAQEADARPDIPVQFRREALPGGKSRLVIDVGAWKSGLAWEWKLPGTTALRETYARGLAAETAIARQ